MAFNSVKDLRPIGQIKSFMKNNYKICMEEHLTILKNTWDKIPHS